MIFYNCCPCCGKKDIHPALAAVDYTVSKKQFEIWECKDCTLRFTQNAPDAGEIGAYYQSENYISHSNTSKGLVNKLYHKVRIRTLEGKRRLVENESGKTRGSMLDVGCGTGAFLHTMDKAGWEITGLEPEESARQKAEELYGLHLNNAERLFSLLPQSFDAITLWHVLEHVHELHAYLKKLRELIKPGGKIFIAVPNYTCYDAKIYKEYWAAYDVPRHLYHFSPAAMNTLLSLHDMYVQSVKPMWYDSFYVSMLSEQYKTGKPQLFRALVKGGFSNCKAVFNREKCSSVIYVISTLPPKNLIPGNLTLSTSPHATSPQPLSGGEGTNLRASIKDQK